MTIYYYFEGIYPNAKLTTTIKYVDFIFSPFGVAVVQSVSKEISQHTLSEKVPSVIERIYIVLEDLKRSRNFHQFLPQFSIRFSFFPTSSALKALKLRGNVLFNGFLQYVLSCLVLLEFLNEKNDGEENPVIVGKQAFMKSSPVFNVNIGHHLRHRKFLTSRVEKIELRQ